MDNPSFLLLLVEVPEAVEFELNVWYDVEHIPEMLGVAGVRTAKRYASQGDRPRYLAWYDIDSPEILYTEQALSVRPQDSRSTAWSQSMRTKMEASRRGVYETLATASPGTDAGVPGALFVAGFESEAAPDDEFATWFRTDFQQRLARVDGVIQARWSRLHPRARPPAEPPGTFLLSVELLNGDTIASAQAFFSGLGIPPDLRPGFHGKYLSHAPCAVLTPADGASQAEAFASRLRTVGIRVPLDDARRIHALHLNVERAARRLERPADMLSESMNGFHLPLPTQAHDADA